MKNISLLALALSMGIPSLAHANTFSKDLATLVKYHIADANEIRGLINDYDAALGNFPKLLSQSPAIARKDSIAQITKIEESIEAQKGYVPFVTSYLFSTEALDLAIASTKTAAAAPMSINYNKNLMDKVNAARIILRKTAIDFNKGI